MRLTGATGIGSVGHTCERMRSRAQRLSPLARVVLTRPDANFLLRQGCAPARTPDTGAVPYVLAVAPISQTGSSGSDPR